MPTTSVVQSSGYLPLLRQESAQRERNLLPALRSARRQPSAVLWAMPAKTPTLAIDNLRLRLSTAAERVDKKM